MNKLNKDQLQKIFLSALLMIVLVYGYFTFLIGPLGKSDLAHAAGIEKLNDQIAKAQSLIKRSHAVQEQARTASETLAQINDLIPDGAPIAWFPPRIHAFFERHNLKGATVRSGGMESAPDPAAHALRTAEWVVDLPAAGATPLGIALAGLENEDKLLEITRLQISAQADAPEKQRVTLNTLTLIK